MKLPPSITLRPIAPEDEEFLLALYASTRVDELALTDWSPEQKAAFVRMQFEAQHRHYQEHYAGASFDVIEVGGEPVGRLYVDRSVERWGDQIRLVDITLAPERRSQGLGGALLAALIDEARSADRPLTIHVEAYNRALSLYRRLGFRPIAHEGVYHLLEWRREV